MSALRNHFICKGLRGKAKIFLKFACVCVYRFPYVNLHFDIPRCLPNLQRGPSPKKKKKKMHGRRLLSTYFFPRSWSLCRRAPGTPRGKAWGALSAGTERHPHTPGRDWPAAQSLRADTSGQPLPRSSRLLFPALGKKSGQRGAGTKDPAVHGERRLRATPYLTPGSNALAGRLRVPTRRPRGVLARGSPNRSPHLASDSGRNHVYGPRWPPLSSGGSSFLAVRWARSRGPPSPQRGGARRSPPRRRKVPDHRARPVPTPQPPPRQPATAGARSPAMPVSPGAAGRSAQPPSSHPALSLPRRPRTARYLGHL